MLKSNTVSLTDTEIRDLEELSQMKRYHLRCKIIIFNNLGFEPKDIAVQQNCHIQTVWSWLRKWEQFGFEGLKIKVREEKPEILEWKNRVLDAVDTRPQELGYGFATWSIKRLWRHMRDQGCPFGHNRIGKVMLEGGLRFRSTKTHPYAVSPDYAERRAKVFEAYLDKDKDHLVLVLDQKIFLSNVGVKGRQWSTSTPTIPSHQWHEGKALMLGVYDVKADRMYHVWLKDLKAQSIRDGFSRIFRMLPTFKKCSIIMDNYQGNRAKLFQKSLKRKNVEVIWLPAWSPHLSLIENKFSLVKAEAIVSVIIKSVRVLKLHVTRWVKYYNGARKQLYAKPKYALG
ncbi:MAG: IS630 family transposase [Candidatus Heimdallarchaeota archaeon]|nr:IS630 family transposase [Candidatus Heimdallarchaeota archaeon]